MPAVRTTLAQALTALAGLLFQNSTPNGELSRRTFYIVAGVQRLYRAFDFDAAIISDSDTTDGDGILDISDFNLGPIPAFRYVGPGDPNLGYELIAFEDLLLYSQGDRKYAILADEDGNWQLKTTEPNTLIDFSWYDSPDISSNNTVIFTPMVIAKAALIYYRQAQDPDADTGVEEGQLSQEVKELTEQHERRRPQKFAHSRRDRYGGGIGET